MQYSIEMCLAASRRASEATSSVGRTLAITKLLRAAVAAGLLIAVSCWPEGVCNAQVAPPSPSAPNANSEAGTLPRAAVQKFVSDFYLSGEDLNAEQIEVVYAPKVSYYGTPTTRAAIIRDQQGYYRRWPQRRYTLIDDTLNIVARTGSAKMFDVSFDYDFDVRGPSRTSMGHGTARLTLDFSVPGGQIAAVEGRVTQRRR
jgi:hypothetical protein